MAAITDYATLSAAIQSWDERSHDADELIGLAEAEFRLHFGPHYARETSGTVSFTSGTATLPTGYIRSLALSHATYGELDQKPLSAIRERRVWDASGVPDIYAITASSIEVAPSYTGDLTFDYEAKLTGLSGSNTTNWLITNAPQAYLAMCMSMAKAKYEDFEKAALYKSQAIDTLDTLGIQSIVAQYGRAGMVIRGSTP